MLSVSTESGADPLDDEQQTFPKSAREERRCPTAEGVGRELPPRDAQAYVALVAELKQRIADARLRAALSVNRELVLLYWGIGRDILARQESEGWGAKVVDRLALDLGRAFPEMTGLSARNLKYMRAFAEAWPDLEFVQQVVALLPWGHNVRLLDAVKAAPERAWYARQAIENGWSRNVLVHQMDVAPCLPDKAAPLRILPGHCPPGSPNSRSRFLKTPTASISSRSGLRCWSGSLSEA